MQRNISRRTLIRSCLIATTMLPALGLIACPAAAAELPPLDPNDPTAKSLGFATDSSKVDASANPTHNATQRCGTCAQFMGKPGDSTGGCNIFVGHSVPQGGWCRVWAQKPAA